MDGQLLLQWLTPLILVLFAGAFAFTARYVEPDRSPLVLATSYIVCATAFGLDQLSLGTDVPAWRSSLEDVFYLGAGALFGAGLGVRAGRAIPAGWMCLCYLVLVAASIWFNTGGDDDEVRTQVVTIGTALFLSSGVWFARDHLNRWYDQLLAGTVLVTSTGLIVSAAALTRDFDDRTAIYEVSAFNAAVSAIIDVGSALAALTLLGGYVADIVARYRSQAEEDQLTGVLNRRGFEGRAQAALRDARRDALSPNWALVIADIDRFKSINDRFGHTVGDDVIRYVGSVLSVAAPMGSTVGRVGGEEFVILLRTDAAFDLEAFALRLRAAVAAMGWSALHPDLRVTASFGVARVHGTYGEAFARADAALYRAKREGRDRVVVDGAEAMEGGLVAAA